MLESIVNVARLGGPVVWLLAAFSLIALTIVVFKAVELALAGRGRSGVQGALRAWEAGRRDQAIDALSRHPQGLATLVATAMKARRAGAPEALVREELQRLAERRMQRLRARLRPLEIIGQISPLLGLFGTVLGMIEAFRRLEEAGSQVDPSILSGGIWQALLTTGVGLAVAIPVVLAHQWLEQRTDAHAHDIEDVLTRVFTSDLRGVAAAADRTSSRAP